MVPTVRFLLPAAALAAVVTVAPASFAFYHDMGVDDATGAAVVDVTLDEWRVALSTSRLAPGRVVFRLTNSGRYPHALALERADGAVGTPSVTLRGGERAEYAVDLPAGRYRLSAYCPIPGHRERGMVAELEVG